MMENLIKNAMNAADSAQGQVDVSAEPRPGGEWVAAVRDNGRGVPAGMEQQIFRPGVSTRQRGWGLGLPLSRRIVEEYHRGRLDLTWSEPGRGGPSSPWPSPRSRPGRGGAEPRPPRAGPAGGPGPPPPRIISGPQLDTPRPVGFRIRTNSTPHIRMVTDVRCQAPRSLGGR